MKKKTKEYQTFVLKDIFLEYELKEYINDIEKIVQRTRDTIIAPTGKVSITAMTGAKNLGNRLEITRRSKRYQTRSIHSFPFL